MMDIPLLKKICETPGAPGFEQKIRALILQEIEGLSDELTLDAMGNIIAIKKGVEDKKVMVAAHMDEIGFMVSHIDEKGFIRFQPLGGFDAKTLTSQRVIVHGKKDLIGVMGCKPIHLMSKEERGKPIPLTEYYIDTGYDVEEVKKYISVGDAVTRQGALLEMGNCVNSKSLDNRISVYILIQTLKKLQGRSLPYDLYAVFTVQEELGLRGAISAAHQINPDFGFGLDVTIAFDVPGAQAHEQVTNLGKGTAIKIKDGSTICDYRMVNYLKETANKHNINWQAEVLPAGGTDTAALQRHGKNGAIAGAISIPLRNLHQTIEMADKADISATIALLSAAIENINTYDWAFK